MERSQFLDLLGQFKLCEMKAACDEIIATALERQPEPWKIAGDRRPENLSIHQRLTPSMPQALSIRSEKPLGLRGTGRVNGYRGAASEHDRSATEAAQRWRWPINGHKAAPPGMSKPWHRERSSMPDKTDLEPDEKEQADEYSNVPTSVIFEAIRREGEHELSRPASALWWSGVAAGLSISTSVVATGFLASILPPAEWAAGVTSLGYTVGFLIVILGRMQLFTENTITPILPLFLAPTRANFAQTGRLWGIVFAANLVGCLAAALVLVHGHIIPDERFVGILDISRHYAEATPFEHFAWGIPAGFLIAALVWVLPRMQSAGEVLMIVIITYIIGLGGMSHVVAGSTELFVLVLSGELGLASAVIGGILPAFAGNVLGGTGIFAALTYAQVREEI